MSYIDFINELLTNSDDSVSQGMADLLEGREVISKIYDSIAFSDIKEDPATIYTFMYYIGYVTIVNASAGAGYSLKIPNLEIKGWYSDIIMSAKNNAKEAEEAGEEAPVVVGNKEPERVKNDESKYSCILE